ncbi:magnesium and cobalt transport protein CorA [Cohnella endophytica]|uniref:Magnesium transport protein CorA n=1 Tax=Cohnella endophytica TaxID=2419778 RepID=A0A494XR48_9BACL|nr:magnesium/cobalt transporter CorA [Cohnella endophytica]RKP53095.1 magnesium and cobalt transport protein CorA [Cohnella endophytica]
MLRILAVTEDQELLENIPLNRLMDDAIKWFWVDFDCPTDEEIQLLDSYFHFHPLAIEDCLHFLQRPKVDHYDDTHFFVLHALHPDSLAAEEIDFFLGPRGIVTFHLAPSQEVEEAWRRMLDPAIRKGKDHNFAAYAIVDKLVDNYFPALYTIEDQLNDLEAKGENKSEADIQALTEQVYDIRADLLRIRRTIIPMRDLLYRVINSDKIAGVKEQHVYFTDIYDHLLKLTEMIESNREMTADLRDSYNSLRSNRMNSIMKTLTVMTTIFMPLTFIAGVYGMNFVNMPELGWNSGYYIVIGIMAALGFGMYGWFKKKGWFD